MANTIDLILVDDHPLIMAGIKAIIQTNKNYQVLGEANNGKAAIELFDQLKPDGVILDIDMPLANGIEVARHIKNSGSNAKIIFLTSHQDMTTFSQAIQIDYSGFIFKENALEEIENCLQLIFEKNSIYESPAFLEYKKEHSDEIEDINKIKSQLNDLTKSEKKVIKLIALGKTTPEIADELFNSYKTIENHRYNICQKLAISGSNNLLSFALEHREVILDI